MQKLGRSTPSDRSLFIVCGMGRLGQECARLLRQSAEVVGVDLRAQDDLAAQVDFPLIQGDCKQPEILQQAGIDRCRAILLTTGDELCNVAAAFAARSINPQVRLIIRSAKDQLNNLLHQQLGNVAAMARSQFSAGAFALSTLSDGTVGQFEVNGQWFRVSTQRIGDAGGSRPIGDVSTPHRRVLTLGRPDSAKRLFAWEPHVTAAAGDVLTLLETTDFAATTARAREKGWAGGGRLSSAPVIGWLTRALRQARFPKAALISLGVMGCLLLLGTVLFKIGEPATTWFDAFNVALVLSFGGFDNLFGSLELPFAISGQLYAFAALTTIASAIFLGILYATLTERVLSARLDIAPRQRIPEGDHTVVVGLNSLGQEIVRVLQAWHVPVIAIADGPMEHAPTNLPALPGPPGETLERVNLPSARSVVVVTDEPLANIEFGLLAKKLNPASILVLRTFDQFFASSIGSLIPDSIGISDYVITAEAMTAAAFGERILDLFHLGGESVLVTEYSVAEGDSLDGLLLAQVAYGYAVAPVHHVRADDQRFLPSDDVRLQAGDRLTVLSTLDGLRAIEAGVRQEPTCRLHIAACNNPEGSFEAANVISRISGCSLEVARAAMASLPHRLDTACIRTRAGGWRAS